MWGGKGAQNTSDGQKNLVTNAVIELFSIIATNERAKEMTTEVKAKNLIKGKAVQFFHSPNCNIRVT